NTTKAKRRINCFTGLNKITSIKQIGNNTNKRKPASQEYSSDDIFIIGTHAKDTVIKRNRNEAISTHKRSFTVYTRYIMGNPSGTITSIKIIAGFVKSLKDVYLKSA